MLVRLGAIIAALVIASLPPTPSITEASTGPAMNCTAMQLHPAPAPNDAPDAPHPDLTVNLPLYPGAVPLQPPLDSPYALSIGSPYLQEANAQFHDADGNAGAWYQKAMPACGWKNPGSWDGNAGTFPRRLQYSSLLSLAPCVVHGSELSAARTRSTATIHGLRITIATGRQGYPRNAIISVHLKVRNITHHGIGLMGGLDTPKVVVLPDNGQEGYDPEAPLGKLTLLTIIGPRPRPFTFGAGHAMTRDEYVVLRGPTLEAEVALAGHGRSGQVTFVRGSRLTLHLSTEPPPAVTISNRPLAATVTSPVPVSGPLLVVSQTQCDDASTGSGWYRVPVRTFTPTIIPPLNQSGCRNLVWHALAGWLNHPVATIAYRTLNWNPGEKSYRDR